MDLRKPGRAWRYTGRRITVKRVDTLIEGRVPERKQQQGLRVDARLFNACLQVGIFKKNSTSELPPSFNRWVHYQMIEALKKYQDERTHAHESGTDRLNHPDGLTDP
jgi:hypothetical protein